MRKPEGKLAEERSNLELRLKQRMKIMKKRRVLATPRSEISISSHKSRFLIAAPYVMALLSSEGPFGIARSIMLNSLKGFWNQ